MDPAYKEASLWTVLDFGEKSYPPETEYWSNNQDELDTDTILLLCVMEGTIVLRSPSGDQNIIAGGFMICRHGENSSYGKTQSNQNCTCLWIRLGGSGLAEHFEILRSRYGSVLDIGVCHPMIQGIRRLRSLTDPADTADPLVVAAAIHRLVMSLFAYAEIGFHGKLTPVNRAIHYLASSPFHPWNLKELAANCGCSREHLGRTFSERYGQSPQQFLTQYRGQRALYLLQHTALSVSSIAAQTGFPNMASLDRIIRNMTGSSPQELRPMKLVDKPPGGSLQGLYDDDRL